MAEELEHIASSIAAPSTIDYATTALHRDREKHREWLRQVLGGQSPESSVGRPTGMLTVPAAELGLLDEAPAAPAPPPAANEGGEPMALSGGADEEERSAARRRAPLVMLLLAVMAALAGGLVVWTTLEESSGDGVAAQAVHIDAAVAMVEPDAQSVTSAEEGTDAGAVAVAEPDAAPVVVSKKGRKDSGRKGRREPPPADPPVERKPAPAAQAESQGAGTLTVAAEPYALVRIDGVEVGSTPIFKRSIQAGSHVVELVHPDSGATRLRKTVTVPAGGHKSVIAR
jgi:hypothetical protein